MLYSYDKYILQCAQCVCCCKIKLFHVTTGLFLITLKVMREFSLAQIKYIDINVEHVEPNT